MPFDPSQPFTVVSDTPPAFDPTKPFTPVQGTTQPRWSNPNIPEMRQTPELEVLKNRVKDFFSPASQGQPLGVGKVAESLASPIAKIPRIKVNPNDSPEMAAGKEAVNVLSNIPEFAETPLAPLAGASKLGLKLVGGAMSAAQLHSLGTQIRQQHKDWDTLTPAQKTQALVDDVGSGTFAAIGGKGALAKEIPFRPQLHSIGGDILQLKQPKGAQPNEAPAIRSEPVPVPRQNLPAPEIPESTTFSKEILDKAGFPNSISQLKLIFPKLKLGDEGWEELFQEARVNARKKAAAVNAVPPSATRLSSVAEALQNAKLLKAKSGAGAKSPETLPKTQEQPVKPSNPAPPLNPGGSEASLPPALKAQSKANNSREAFEALAKQKGTTLPGKPAASTEPSSHEILDAWQASRAFGNDRHSRMLYVQRQLKKVYPTLSGKKLWNMIDEATAPSHPASMSGPGSPHVSQGTDEGTPWGEGGQDVMGVRHETRVKQAKAGLPVVAERGQGTTMEEAIANGRALLSQDPSAAERVRAKWEQSHSLNADDFGIARAKYEEVMAAGRRVEEQFGTNSPEYRSRTEQARLWSKLTKEMATESHKIFVGQQGETDIDAGSVLSMETAFSDATDKPFTPKQRQTATEIAQKVTNATQEANKATQNVHSELDKEAGVQTPHGQSKRPITNPTTISDVQKVFSGHKPGKPFTPEQVQSLWKYARTAYVDKGGTDFGDLLTNLSVDTGLSRDEVANALAQPKNVKRLTDEMYRKQSERRRAVQSAKNWLRNQQFPGWLRFIRTIPRVFFIDKIFGHGTVGMITHAGLNVFNPGAWSKWFPAFIKQFQFVFSPVAHEKWAQDIIRRPNYITARRAGLANDPFRYSDDYQNAAMKTFMGRFSGLVGGRGFDALKEFRQTRFDQAWNSLPESLKTKDMATLLADSINHATGIVKTPFGEWANWTFFAPKLEASRWAWLIGDTAKTAKTFKEWKSATPEAKYAAVADLKQKAAIVGTYYGLLMLNQGVLNLTDSKQKVNFTNPRKSDFLQFKVAGHTVGVVSPLLGIVRLFANLLHDSAGQRGRVESLTPRGPEIGSQLGEYARGKLSPFASTAYDVASQSDYEGRPLPWSKDRTPANLRREGLGPYTYGQYAAQQFTPIPVEEAVKEVWADQGMSEGQINTLMKVLVAAVTVGATGVRVSPDYSQHQP